MYTLRVKMPEEITLHQLDELCETLNHKIGGESFELSGIGESRYIVTTLKKRPTEQELVELGMVLGAVLAIIMK